MSALRRIAMVDAWRNRLRSMDLGPGSRPSFWFYLRNARRRSLALWIGAYSAVGLFVYLARGWAPGVWASALVLCVATASLLISWQVARGGPGQGEPPNP